MPRNVEIKARVADANAIARRATAVAGQAPQWIDQDDTFFACPRGRLKLRTFGDGLAELIFYRRPDAAGPRTSDYRRLPVTQPDALRDLLTLALGSGGRVRKRRQLYLVGRTRIHIDRVEGLGTFAELEVMLADDEPESAGVAVARALMAKLAIAPEALVDGAYVDLIASRPSTDG